MTLALAFQASRIPSYVVDLSGSILEANPAFCRLIKRSPSEVIGTNHHQFFAPQTHSSKKCLTLEQRFAIAPDWSSIRCFQCGEAQVWVELHFSALRNEDDSYLGALVQALDITAQCKMKKDIEEQQKEMEQFVYISSHDLREPCNSMAGLATLLKRRYGGCLDDTGNHWLDEIVKIAKQTNKKIDALLELSRVGRDTPTGVFSLGSAVEEAERALFSMIKENGASIQIDLSQGNPTFIGDRSMIAQVFQNLFSNSIKYSTEKPTIQIRTSPYEGEQWCISVTDNGLGFDMKFKERIFKVFQRLYTLAQYPGTGMGLSIAKKIIDRHGGNIWVESEPGKGTTFYFTLPVSPVDQ